MFSLFKQKIIAIVNSNSNYGKQWATRSIFFISGYAFASWAALVPFVKINTDINEATLGLLLLCLGGGALIAMPIAGILASRFGCRIILLITILICCFLLPFLSITANIGLLTIMLLLFGVAIGIADCVMNIQAILVEKAANKTLMSSFHGFFSIGCIAGAIIMSVLMTIGVNALHSSSMVTISILLLLSISYRNFLSYAPPSEGQLFRFPKGIVLMLGVVCFIVFLAEGAILDWGAIFLTEYRNMSVTLGSLGYACFAIMMTIGRLTGDTLITRYGTRSIVILGAIVAIFGIICVIVIPFWLFTLFGYALIGLGCSNIVPVMFSTIGRQQSMPQSVAVPAVTTMGYAGVLVGPASIGFIAHQSNLLIAFGLVGCLLTVAIIILKRINFS